MTTESFLKRFHRALCYAAKVNGHRPDSAWLTSDDLYDAMATWDYFAVGDIGPHEIIPDGSTAKLYGVWLYGDFKDTYDRSEIGILGGWKEAID